MTTHVICTTGESGQRSPNLDLGIRIKGKLLLPAPVICMLSLVLIPWVANHMDMITAWTSSSCRSDHRMDIIIVQYRYRHRVAVGWWTQGTPSCGNLRKRVLGFCRAHEIPCVIRSFALTESKVQSVLSKIHNKTYPTAATANQL